jgi:hypothetical protein
MTTAQLRRDIKKRVDALDSDRLMSAADFLEYLATRENGGRTTKNKKEAALVRRLAKAELEIAQGRVTPVHALRRKY